MFKINHSWLKHILVVPALFMLVAPARSATPNNLFFLHHSTGDGLIGGGMRATVASYNSAHGTAFAFWDHGYNDAGLRDPSGEFTGTGYNIPNDNTDPDGLYYLWTSAGDDAVTCRNTIIANHEVIAFKSCFPASNIPDAGTLAQYKTWYLAMRDVFDQHPERLFVVMSTPSLHRLATDATQAANARQFADWLKSQEYLSGHTNVVCFDLFSYLAGSDDFLKYEYEGSHSDSDSHPNAQANETVGPIFANFLISSALDYNASDGATNFGVPAIMANGETNEVVVSSPAPVTISVAMSAGAAAGTQADWWVIAFAQDAGEWYYLDGNMAWPMFSGDLAECRPAYQGALFDLPATTVLNEYVLPAGHYSFYFAADRRDGGLNYPSGPIAYSQVMVTVE